MIVTEAMRLADKARFHPANPADYASSIGMPYEDESGVIQYACVGCWWCCTEDTAPLHVEHAQGGES